jgi:hypothetical protein
VAEHLVTGISQTSEPTQLEKALCEEPAVDCDKLAVITADERTSEHETSILEFIHVGQPHQTTDTDTDVITGNVGMITNLNGVNIPGISSDTRYVGFFAHPQVIDHLADWDIPEDQVQNYNDAIEAGRSVVTYKATPGEASGVEQAFRDAGLKNVKTFE